MPISSHASTKSTVAEHHDLAAKINPVQDGVNGFKSILQCTSEMVSRVNADLPPSALEAKQLLLDRLHKASRDRNEKYLDPRQPAQTPTMIRSFYKLLYQPVYSK